MSQSLPPGPNGIPVFGNTVQYLRAPCERRERWAEEYGSVVSVDILGMDMYMLTEPGLIKQVLMTDTGKYKKVESTKEHLERTIGDGLLLSEGDFWKRQRQLIQPAFYPDRLREYADVMTDCATAKADSWEPGETYDVEEEMRSLTLEILVKALFGTDVDPERRAKIRDAVKALMLRTKPSTLPVVYFLPDWVPLPVNIRYNRGIRQINESIDELIEIRRNEDEHGEDLLSILVEAETDEGVGMSDETLKDEITTMLFAGHETTALTLTFTWDLLARNPGVREKLHRELDDVLDGRAPTFDDLPDLEYTEQVVKESLRLYPPAHDIRRQTTQEVTLDGYTIPEDTIVSMPLWVLHRDQQWFDDPEAFRPERWSGGLEADLPEFAYFPFGGGPRQCIGDTFATNEAKLTLATFARRYELDHAVDEPLDVMAGVTLQPRDGLDMVVRER